MRTISSPSRKTVQRIPALLIALAIGLLALQGSPAQASAYRYWSYWQGASGTWVAATTGPGDYTLVDGDVQGWRFGITTEAPTAGPDNPPVYADLCPAESAQSAPAGSVRVAVVVDSGFTADAPSGETPPADTISCVSVPEGSTGNQALAAAGAVRATDGLVCAINAYPSTECGAEVSDAAAKDAASAAASEKPNPATATAVSAATSEASSGPSPVLLLSLGALLVLGIGAAVVFARRAKDNG